MSRPGAKTGFKPARWLFGFAVVTIVAAILVIGILSYRQHAAIQAVQRFGGKIGYSKRAPEWLRQVLGDKATWLFDEVGFVNLDGCDFDDDDFEFLLPHFQRFGKLEMFALSNTRISDTSVKRLSVFPNLHHVDLSNTRVSDTGLKDLGVCPNLRAIALGNTLITDKGLPYLARLKRIESLQLDQTAVTDEGMSALRGLTKLSDLSVSNTGVTDEGVHMLERALPALAIYDD